MVQTAERQLQKDNAVDHQTNDAGSNDREDKPTLIRIPGHYQHGTQTIGREPSLTVYFVNRLYDYRNPDEERRPWNDPGIIPSEINGNKNDPRVNQPWDWSYPPPK